MIIALIGLGVGLLTWAAGRPDIAYWVWAAGTAPMVLGLAVSIINALMQGLMGVDAVVLLSMSGALALGEMLVGVVIAVMYAGGKVSEVFPVDRAERNLRALVNRAPRIAHRISGATVQVVPIVDVGISDTISVHAGEVVPVDGTVDAGDKMIDESALTDGPIPVNRTSGTMVLSGTPQRG